MSKKPLNYLQLSVVQMTTALYNESSSRLTSAMIRLVFKFASEGTNKIEFSKNLKNFMKKELSVQGSKANSLIEELCESYSFFRLCKVGDSTGLECTLLDDSLKYRQAGAKGAKAKAQLKRSQKIESVVQQVEPDSHSDIDQMGVDQLDSFMNGDGNF
jgi:HD superfamily phosphohydrolase